MVFLIVPYINKMATDGGGGAVMADTATVQARYWSRVEISTLKQFFSLIFVQIHTNEFIQLLYKLYSTNSYTVWFLYQFIQYLYELYSTNSYKAVSPAAPTFRVHPAAPTFRVHQATPIYEILVGCGV